MSEKVVSAINATVSGRVQGVMFRDFTRRKAQALGLVGEVQNMVDGTAHVYAEGEKEQLEELITLLKRGPLLARVDDVAYTEVKPKGGFSSFSIVYE